MIDRRLPSSYLFTLKLAGFSVALAISFRKLTIPKVAVKLLQPKK